MGEQIRLGTVYRLNVVSHLAFNESQKNDRILDVGCHDGYMLSKLVSPFKVGIDLEPQRNIPGLNLICGDGRFLPFSTGCFDQVYAMDVIEHLVDDRSLAADLLRIVAPGGALLLTTPSREIRLTPSFLTRWISRQWGHYYRLGYSRQELGQLFEHPDYDLKISPWNAPAYRFLYLLMWATNKVWPVLARIILKWVSDWDARHGEGMNGFFILEVRRREKAA